MKLKTFILFVIFMTALGFNYSLNDGNDSSSVFLLKNIEALAQENNGYARGYKMDTIKIYGGYCMMQSITGAFSMPNYINIDCCKTATYMEGCDFSAQNKDC